MVASIQVLDANGVEQTVNTLPALGQVASSASLPVVAANNDPVVVATGTQADSAWTSGSGSIIAILKAIVTTAIAAGSNIIGKVGIDQTTPGTTNGVVLNAALPAGANIIGKVGIDQTTPGTTNGVVLNAAENHVGLVGGSSAHLTNAPPVTAGAYTSGMVVGGLISILNAARVSGGSGLIQNVLVTVKTALTAPFDVFFFDTNPTNSTFTDNAALALNAADLPYLCGVAHCTDAIAGGTPEILQAVNCPIPFKLSTGTTLYAVIVIRGAETLASTSAIQLSTLILQD